MSLVKWLGEAVNREPVESVETGAREVANRLTRGLLHVRGTVGAGLLTLGTVVVVSAEEPARRIVLFLAYLLGSAFVRPKPNYSNLGQAGGLTLRGIRR